MAAEADRRKNWRRSSKPPRTLRELAGTLGLFRKPVEAKASADDVCSRQLMELLIELRADARKAKDFATADKIRKRLGGWASRWKTAPAARNGRGSRKDVRWPLSVVRGGN